MFIGICQYIFAEYLPYTLLIPFLMVITSMSDALVSDNMNSINTIDSLVPLEVLIAISIFDLCNILGRCEDLFAVENRCYLFQTKCILLDGK